MKTLFREHLFSFPWDVNKETLGQEKKWSFSDDLLWHSRSSGLEGMLFLLTVLWFVQLMPVHWVPLCKLDKCVSWQTERNITVHSFTNSAVWILTSIHSKSNRSSTLTAFHFSHFFLQFTHSLFRLSTSVVKTKFTGLHRTVKKLHNSILDIDEMLSTFFNTKVTIISYFYTYTMLEFLISSPQASQHFL